MVFYGFFCLLLSRTTFFRFNRISLLAGTVICMLLPFVVFTTHEESLFSFPLQTLEQLLTEKENEISSSATDLDIVPVTAVGNSAGYLSRIIVSVYLTGFCMTLILFMISTFRMWQLIRGAEIRKEEKYLLVIVRQPISSFNWGRYIVISKKDYECHPEEILLHESMHLRNHHTVDLWFMQILLVLHWYNPAVWLLKRKLQEIHEYEADNDVINTGIDATRYQLLLVKKAAGTRLYSMASGFNHSKLKNRITMMLKKRTNRWARLRLLLLVPVMAGTLYVFAQPEVNETLEQVANGEQRLRTDDDYDYLSLINYFEKERKAGSGYPRVGSACRGRMNMLLVNMRNEIMFNGERIAPEILKATLVKDMYNAWLKSGRKEMQSISYSVDRGLGIDELKVTLQTVKDAYAEIRESIANELGDKRKESLDRAFPIFVSEFSATEPSRKDLDNTIISGVTIILYGDPGVKQEMKNFTLKELKDEITAVRETMKDPDTFVVGLKVDKNCSAGVVNDVKETLRSASALKINYENGRKLKM